MALLLPGVAPLPIPADPPGFTGSIALSSVVVNGLGAVFKAPLPLLLVGKSIVVF
jgi:hypothetical protein